MNPQIIWESEQDKLRLVHSKHSVTGEELLEVERMVNHDAMGAEVWHPLNFAEGVINVLKAALLDRIREERA